MKNFGLQIFRIKKFKATLILCNRFLHLKIVSIKYSDTSIISLTFIANLRLNRRKISMKTGFEDG